MSLFFDVLAMYLLIFPDFSGCASSSISVQIHDGAYYSSFFVRYHQILSLIRPLVLFVLSRFCPLSGIFRKYVFVQFFNALRGSLCTFSTNFCEEYGHFSVYIPQNPNVQNLCEMGHNRLYVPGVQTFAHLCFHTIRARFAAFPV